MPIIVESDHPSKNILLKENIFVMDELRAVTQSIRALNVLLLNLMPNKLETETQIFKLLANSPLQVNLDLLIPATHVVKNTSKSYLDKYYKTFDEIKDNKYDAMIITGAPLEQYSFEEVTYWDELKKIMDYSKKNVTSTMFICWASQAGLYHFFDIQKEVLPKKLSGVYKQENLKSQDPLLRGFEDEFYVPQSRHTGVSKEDILSNPELELLAYSKDSGVHLVRTVDKKQIFISGHCEYDTDTLHNEYIRDLNKGLNPEIPINYYLDDNVANKPVNKWRSHASLLFANWLNYYVYQITPYEFE